jgi:hypothetical protein
MRLTADVPARLEARHLGQHGETPTEATRLIARLLLRGNIESGLSCKVTPGGDSPVRFVRRASKAEQPQLEKIVPPGKPITLGISGGEKQGGPPPDSRAYLHLGPPDAMHRVIRFGAKA